MQSHNKPASAWRFAYQLRHPTDRSYPLGKPSHSKASVGMAGCVPVTSLTGRTVEQAVSQPTKASAWPAGCLLHPLTGRTVEPKWFRKPKSAWPAGCLLHPLTGRTVERCRFVTKGVSMAGCGTRLHPLTSRTVEQSSLVQSRPVRLCGLGTRYVPLTGRAVLNETVS